MNHFAIEIGPVAKGGSGTYLDIILNVVTEESEFKR